MLGFQSLNMMKEWEVRVQEDCLHVITPSLEELQQAHLYILNNSNEVLPYILRREALVKES